MPNADRTRRRRMLDAVARSRIALPSLLRDERTVACGYLVVGVALVYAALFDQGAALGLAVGGVLGHEDALHELFHDGRHLANAPCH